MLKLSDGNKTDARYLKKIYKYWVKSSVVCKTEGCKKRLKLRITLQKENPEYCYKCWKKKEFNRRNPGYAPKKIFETYKKEQEMLCKQ